MKVHYYMGFDTYLQARDYMLRILKDYDPLGYDTHLCIYREHGQFIVSGSRYAHCD